MDPLFLMEIIARVSLCVVYFALGLFFRKKDAESKAEGMKNKFFTGFFLVFLALFIVQVALTVYEFIPGSNIEREFPDYDDNQDQTWFLGNFYRPLFIIALIAALFWTAFMVYPLEEILGWEKTPLTKVLLILCAALALVFIPTLLFTPYTLVVLIATFAGVGIGLFFNLGVNLKLAIQSPPKSEIRSRSIKILIAFVLFYVGFIWALQVGWAKALIPGFTLSHDVLFGSALQVIAAFLYWSGFRTSDNA